MPYCETPDSPGILGSRAGVCIPSKRLILIRDVLGEADRIAVLEHELEHARGAGDEIEAGRPLLDFERAALLKQDGRYLESLLRMDIRKKERGLAKLAMKDGQSAEEFEAFREQLERALAYRRGLLERLRRAR